MNLSCLFGLARRVACYIIKEYCICKLKGEKTLQHLLLFRVMFNSFLTQRWTSLCSVYFVTEINENCSSVLRKRKILLNLKLQLTTWFSFYWFIRYIYIYIHTHTHTHTHTIWAFPSSSAVKNPPAMQKTWEMWVWSLGQKDHLEEVMATHSGILAWRDSINRGVYKSIYWVSSMKGSSECHAWSVPCLPY